MKRMMIALAVAVLMASPAAAMDCGDPGEAGRQAWLDSCLLALADDSAFGPMEPFGPNWIVAENQPCQLYNEFPRPDETVTWSGGCVDGKAHGEGRFEWHHPNGVDVYVGSVRAGLMHGRGVFTRTGAGGGRYEGEYVDGWQHGRGVSTWANGNRYEGEYANGSPHGRGIYTWASGDRHEGEYVDGSPHGRGIYTWANGTRRVGEWRNGEHMRWQ